MKTFKGISLLETAAERENLLKSMPLYMQQKMMIPLVPGKSQSVLPIFVAADNSVIKDKEAEVMMEKWYKENRGKLEAHLDLLPDLSASAKDRSALMAIYNAANGHSWDNQDGWGSNQPIDEWHGVTVEPRFYLVTNGGRMIYRIGRVTRLDLGHNNMYRSKESDSNGVLSNRIGDLTCLEYLNLSYSFLCGVIPETLYNLTELKKLYLHFNQLSGGISSNIGKLTKLEILQLDHNRLSGFIPDAIGKLVNLTTLCLHENNLFNHDIHRQLRLTAKQQQLYNALDKELRKKLLVLNLLPIRSTNIPDSICNLAKLEKFCVYQNHLKGKISGNIQKHKYYKSPDWHLLTKAGGTRYDQQEGFGLTE